MTSERQGQLRALGLVMLPIAMFLERGVYYQFRAAFAVRAMNAGGTTKEIGAALAMGIWIGIAGYVLGGLLSLVRGHLAALIGLGTSLLGYLLMTVAPLGWATADVLVRVGSACTALGFYAAIGVAGSSLGQRVAGMALLQVAAHVGSFLGPLGATAARMSPWLAYVGLLPIVLALLLLAVDWWMAATWERAHRPSDSPINWAFALSVSGLVICVGALSAPTEYFATQALFDSIAHGSGPTSLFVLASLTTSGPALIAGIGLSLVGLIAPHAMRPAPVAGVGLLGAGLGAGLGVVGSALSVGAAFWIAALFSGFGAGVLDVLLLGVLVGAFSRRWVGLGLLAYFVTTRVVSGVLYAIGRVSEDAGIVVAGLSAGGVLVLGAVALLLGKPLNAWLTKEPKESEAGQPA